MKRNVLILGGAMLITASLAVLLYVFSPLISFYALPRPAAAASDMLPSGKAGGNLQPTGNRLLIPKIGVDIEIAEGDNSSALDRGAWHDPGSADPGEKANIVMSGHRFRFLPPNNKTFYLLDKLERGDAITVLWQAKKYEYKVDRVFGVAPNDTSILARGREEKLTLYTCTPLFTQDRRLVVVAKP